MKSILEKLQEDGKIISATCNGYKSCGLCKIKMTKGLSVVSKDEERLLTKKEIDEGIRLACCQKYTDTLKYEVLKQSMDIMEEMSLNTNFDNEFEDGYGIIMDIGTTTIVIKLISLENGQTIQTDSLRNPQGIYGGDVISRIKYDMNTQGVLHSILLSEVEKKIIKYHKYNIKRMVACGNTVMTHLFIGENVETLGKVPFKIPKKEIQIIDSSVLFKNMNNSFPIITFPHIDAYVGGDIVAGIIANDIDLSKNTKMLLDLGTNGEIVVGNNKKIITTSTAAGPAFEGVGITCGGPSIPGAITRVRILENDKISYETIYDEEPQCICGSGLISIVAELRRKNIINELGRFQKSLDKFFITEKIYITEKDIQIFQLAKSAIQAGIYILMKDNEQLGTIYISGGFAATIEVKDIITLKLIPQQYSENIKIIKNSALSGAYVLLFTKKYDRLKHIMEISQNMNLAKHPEFEDILIESLYF